MTQLSDVDTADLRLLLVVAEMGSFGRAGRQLDLTQQAVSLRVGVLERQLGVQLFERSKQGASLTEDGALVAAWSSSVVHAAERFISSVKTLQPAKRSTLRISASFTIAEYVLPGLIAQARRQRPNVTVTLGVMNSQAVVENVRNAKADMGFTEDSLSPRGLKSKVIGSDRLVLVVNPTHPLRRRRRPLSIEQLASLGLITREAGSGTRSFLHDVMGKAAFEETSVIEASSTASLKAAVISTGEPGVVSALAVEAELRDRTLYEVQVEGLDVKRQLRAVWNASKPLSPAADALLQLAISRP